MKQFEIITQVDCHRCEMLRLWFRANKIPFHEIPIEEKENHQTLLKSLNFRKKFCKDEKCKVYTPLLHLQETGEYFHKQLFGIDAIRGHFIRKLLDIPPETKIKIDDPVPRLCKNKLVQKLLEKYILAIAICRTSGELLYSIQIDKTLKLSFLTQFISGFSIFGSENLGHIDRILIRGLEVEMNIVEQHDLIFTVLFRPRMIQDYLDVESEKVLESFYKMFKIQLIQKKTKPALYYSFDKEMCLAIQNYLVRIGIIECVDCTLEIPLLRLVPQENR